MKTASPQRRRLTSGLSAGRVPKATRKGRNSGYVPANSAKAQVEKYREELAGIEAALKAPKLLYSHMVRLEAREIQLRHLIATEGR